jgi:hypothetical protein
MATKRAANDPLDGDPSKRLNTGVAAPGMLTPDQIKAMMEKTKRELEMRKAQLGISTTVQPATAVPMPMQAAYVHNDDHRAVIDVTMGSVCPMRSFFGRAEK